MFVCQLTAYFRPGVPKDECEMAVEPFLEVVPFGINFQGTEGAGFETHTVEFVDNLQDFDPEDVVHAANKVKHDDRVRVLDMLIWEMDTDEPDHRVQKGD
jgi:hypothetical protein